jgi:hypothetical protein
MPTGFPYGTLEDFPRVVNFFHNVSCGIKYEQEKDNEQRLNSNRQQEH